MKTHYANYCQQLRTPKETVLSFCHKQDDDESDPIRIAMTHETFEELREMVNRKQESNEQPATEKPKK